MSTYSKYGNVKVEVDGHVFDSKTEANRYHHHKMMMHAERPADRVIKIDLQPEFVLVPAWDEVWYVKNERTGKMNKRSRTHRAVKYFADFGILYGDLRYVVEDVKGMKTAVYSLKKSMLLYQKRDIPADAFTFREVIYSAKYGWHERT